MKHESTKPRKHEKHIAFRVFTFSCFRASTTAFALAVVAGLAVIGQRAEAHKPITSKYTYNDDVFPILRDRCSSCHVAGGVAPMSLMTYDDAFP